MDTRTTAGGARWRWANRPVSTGPDEMPVLERKSECGRLRARLGRRARHAQGPRRASGTTPMPSERR